MADPVGQTKLAAGNQRQDLVIHFRFRHLGPVLGELLARGRSIVLEVLRRCLEPVVRRLELGVLAAQRRVVLLEPADAIVQLREFLEDAVEVDVDALDA